MSHYKSNVRDQVFNLFEVFGLDKALGEGEYADLDADTAKEMLGEIARLAEGPDRRIVRRQRPQPPDLRPQDALGDAARAVQEVGARHARRRLGQRRPRRGTRRHARAQGARCGRCTSTSSAPTRPCGCTAAAQVSPTSSTTSAPKSRRSGPCIAAERGWGATMVLTEPDAGSDVGAGRTKAVKQDDGSWHIDGVKRFITSGDSGDLFENIFHLVLARPEGAGPGTKGLSLFFVPKFLFDFETGELGERNGVLRHQRRAQDGPEGLGHLRAVARPARQARQGLARRRDPRGHRADVRRHRAGPHDGRHQGHRDPVDRLPERARLREEPRAGRRHDPDDRQDRAARDHHASPRRASQPDDPEGVRRGSARAVHVHRHLPGRRRWPRRCTMSTPSWRSRSTT